MNIEANEALMKSVYFLPKRSNMYPTNMVMTRVMRPE
jgi:hypothetical protein